MAMPAPTDWNSQMRERVRNKDLADWVKAAGLSNSTQARKIQALQPSL